MKKEHEIIITKIKQYLETYPDIRFGQALFNLNINQFDVNSPLFDHYFLRDIHTDSDQQIIARIEKTEKLINL